jgi:hypothetical protein
MLRGEMDNENVRNFADTLMKEANAISVLVPGQKQRSACRERRRFWLVHHV